MLPIRSVPDGVVPMRCAVRVWAVPLAAAVLTPLVLPGTQAAFVATTGSAGNSWAAATVQPASGLGAVQNCDTVPPSAALAWAASPSGFVTGYYLTLVGSATQTLGRVTTTTATALATGTTYTWRLTAYYQSWTSSTVSTSLTVNCPSASYGSTGSAGTATSSGNATATYPAGTQSGDLLLLVEMNNANQAITTPTGWTLAADQANNSPQYRFTVWWKTAGAETSVDVNIHTNSSGAAVWVMDYPRPPGAPALSAPAVQQGLSGPTGTLTPTPDVTTAATSRVISLVALRAANPLSLANPNGFTFRYDAPAGGSLGDALGVADTATAGAATPPSPTWAQSGTPANWGWATLAFP